MTCTVPDVRTKRELKMILDHPDGDVVIQDPSIFNPFYGSLREYIRSRGECFLTNHPKRSWFAHITPRDDGRLKVD